MSKYTKYIGAMLALVVVIGFVLIADYTPRAKGEVGGRPLLFPFTFSLPTLNVPGVNNPALGKEAYAVFKQYLEFAKAHNLEGLRTVSHQISATCNDPTKEAECFRLMDSVYSISQDFKEEDFKHTYADNKQIVMFTDFINLSEADNAEPIRFVLFFTRDSEARPKVLGLKLCLPDKMNPENCVETNTFKLDKDNNGWWDQVEAFFYK